MRFPAAFTEVRTCYRHTAGAVGVALAAWLVERGWAELVLPPEPAVRRGGVPNLGAFRLLPAGPAALAALGVPAAGLQPGTAYAACADYTERLPDGRRGVPHVAGTLGAALTGWLLQQGYAQRLGQPGSVYERRALMLTPKGRATLEDLGVRWASPTATGPGHPGSGEARRAHRAAEASPMAAPAAAATASSGGVSRP